MNTKTNPFNDKQEELIRNHFKKVDRALGLNSDTPEYLTESFNRKLRELAYPKKRSFWNLKSLWSSILASFSLGFIMSQLFMTPALFVTKGIDDVYVDQATSKIQVISFYKDVPRDFANKIISEALDSNLEISIEKANTKLQLSISPLISNKADQKEFKELLGIKQENEGVITVIINPTAN